mmetsp:Transcript_29969/g.36392  ORF Transcript_29969/g.36392 Transcript_29969/m.36392 type:complete len:106 (-) Transcript_29969:119-436(-)
MTLYTNCHPSSFKEHISLNEKGPPAVSFQFKSDLMRNDPLGYQFIRQFFKEIPSDVFWQIELGVSTDKDLGIGRISRTNGSSNWEEEDPPPKKSWFPCFAMVSPR